MIKPGWNIDLVCGAMLAVLIAGMALVSHFWTPYDYSKIVSAERFLPPQGAHLMGTDNFGRDIFSRIMAGCKYTILAALSTVVLSAAAGSSLGLISGYAGGIADEIIMRLMDALSSFPGILLALVMISLMGTGAFSLVCALFVLFIPSYVRIMRSGMLQYKTRDFVLAARIMGSSSFRIIFVQILPNLAPSLLSATVIGLSNAILAEAAMSYLGLGIPPPIPSWGRMLSESQNFLFAAPWCAVAPGVMIMVTVISFHFLGEGIRRRYC
ncbi:MAG: ABC transporter permease [Treponema sp.]|jgi:peptide/nickel transport system permease protein|nr:ABC transporter permease [Treponema sp.]